MFNLVHKFYLYHNHTGSNITTKNWPFFLLCLNVKILALWCPKATPISPFSPKNGQIVIKPKFIWKNGVSDNFEINWLLLVPN